MYSTRIVKFKLRRGTDVQRRSVIFKSGELVYAYDTKRCYVGDGSTLGGVSISNVNNVSTSFPTTNTLGDYTYRTDLLRAYIYRQTGFEYIGPYPDTTTINFSGNYLQVVSGSVTRDKLSNSIASLTGGLLFDNVNGMRVSYDDTLVIDNGQLTVNSNTTKAIITPLSADSLTLTNANLQTYQGILTANGTFLVISVNGVRQGIRLWNPPLIDIEPPGPPEPVITEFILAEDSSPIISNDDDNIVWTDADRNYIFTEEGDYLMNENMDDLTWDS